MPAPSASAPSSLPQKGTSMADVEKSFGEPTTRHPSVGGDTPKQPPITRWDYPGFTVVFEKDKVIHSVVPGAPPRIENQSGLQPAEVPMETPSATYEAPAAPAEPAPPPAEPAPPPAEAPAQSDGLRPGEMQPPPADLSAPSSNEPKPNQ